MIGSETFPADLPGNLLSVPRSIQAFLPPASILLADHPILYLIILTACQGEPCFAPVVEKPGQGMYTDFREEMLVVQMNT